MKVAYIAGPYRADTIDGVVDHILMARRAACDLWRLGFAVICPHLNSALFDGIVPDERFLDGYLEILRRCDVVVTLPRWQESEGTRWELREAWELKLPVFNWPDDLERLEALA